MYFKNKLRELYNNDEINLFVDMDGVITDYDFGNKLDFKEKRPIRSNIKILTDLSKENNINLYILSICKTDEQIKEKNNWLDKHAPIFAKDKRYIISKETIKNTSSKELKLLTIKEVTKELKLKNIVIIDDDNGILKYLSESNLNITLFQDSSIID